MNTTTQLKNHSMTSVLCVGRVEKALHRFCYRVENYSRYCLNAQSKNHPVITNKDRLRGAAI